MFCTTIGRTLLLVYLRCGVIVVEADIDGLTLLDEGLDLLGNALLDTLFCIPERDICWGGVGTLCDGFWLLGLHNVPIATRSSGSRPVKRN